jgi:hypothetical protein
MITVGVLVGLLIVSGLLSAILPGALGGGGSDAPIGLQPPSLETFDIPAAEVTLPFNLPGATLVPGVDKVGDATGAYTMTPLSIVLILLGAILVPTIITGIVLYLLIGRLLTGIAESTKTSEEYLAKEAAFVQAEEAFVKKYKEERPPTDRPEHERPGYSAVSTALVIAALSGMFGSVLGASFGGEGNLLVWTLVAAAVGLGIGLLVVRRNTIKELDSTESQPIAWGTVWVVFTGVIVVGLGVGLMVWVRQGGAPEESMRWLMQWM